MFQLPAKAKPLAKCELSAKTRVFVVIHPTFAGALFIFLLYNPRIWTQKNRSFNRQTQEIQIQRQSASICGPLTYKLEPDKDAATKGTSMGVNPKASLISKNTGLKIEKVSGVDHRLSMKRQPEIRQALRN